jgi:putative phosphoribosyl transferase
MIALNEAAMVHLRCPRELVIAAGMRYFFEGPATLDAVIGDASRWLLAHLAGGGRNVRNC